MGEHDNDEPKAPRRDQTNEHLRLERDRADATTEAERLSVDGIADEVLRVARQRADEVVQAARDDADERRPKSADGDASSARENRQADRLLERERSTADATLEAERAARRSYLSIFLAAERSATDQSLIGEREHADTELATRDEVLATVSHDLRSLLHGLALNAEMLTKHSPAGPEGDALRKHGAMSKRLVARMSRIISDLLDVASIEAGQLALVPDRAEVAELLRDTLDAFGPTATAAGIALAAELPAGPLRAWLDAGRVLQVLANLVGNAIKFTPAGGRVAVTVEEEGASLHFRVSDTGQGIPEAELLRVFERFRQVGRDHRGLGLGLYISKCVVEAHGGRMWAESAPGAGTTMHFVLPTGAAAG